MYQLIDLMKNEGLLDISPARGDNFESQVTRYVKLHRLMHQDIMMITQQNDCCPEKIKKHTTLKSFIGIFHVAEDGSLKSVWDVPVATGNESLVPENEIMEGDTVYAGDMAFLLTGVIGEGGEGRIFTFQSDQIAGDDHVIKIFRRTKIDTFRRKKVEEMVRMHNSRKGLCLPEYVVTDKEGCFRGYVMQRAKGTELSEFFMDPISNIPEDWEKKDMVHLTIKILENIVYLHDNHILLGDINPHNILVDGKRRISFVDCDSYQIGNIPCAVGHDEYTAPEIMGRDFSSFLRTEQEEAFAVATLVFQMMVIGTLPYSRKGGGDNVDNIMEGDFVYPFIDRSSRGRIPDGPARYEWSNLMFKVKEALFETFSADGEHNRPGKRLHAEDWLDLMHRYRSWLEKKQDDISTNEIFPAGYKVVMGGGEYGVCRCCGRKIYKSALVEGFCRQCLDKEAEEDYECAEPGCHEVLTYTNREKYVLKRPRDRFCSIHAGLLKEIRTCRCCGEKFTLTNEQYYGYIDRGLKLPRTCPACRKARRESKAG